MKLVEVVCLCCVVKKHTDTERSPSFIPNLEITGFPDDFIDKFSARQHIIGFPVYFQVL